MFFNEIAKKYELIKEAVNAENTVDKIKKRIESLKKQETKLNKQAEDQKTNNEKINADISSQEGKAKTLDSEIKLLQTNIKEKESSLAPLKKKWDVLDDEQKKLVEYFSELS